MHTNNDWGWRQQDFLSPKRCKYYPNRSGQKNPQKTPKNPLFPWNIVKRTRWSLPVLGCIYLLCCTRFYTQPKCLIFLVCFNIQEMLIFVKPGQMIICQTFYVNLLQGVRVVTRRHFFRTNFHKMFEILLKLVILNLCILWSILTKLIFSYYCPL